MRRRRLLASLASVPLLSGCNSRSTDSSSTLNATSSSEQTTVRTATPTHTETTVSNASAAPTTPQSPYDLTTPDGEILCEGGSSWEDYSIGEAIDGRVGGFTLSVSPSSVARGEELTAVLENVSNTGQETGGYRKFAVQERTEFDWNHILTITNRGFPSIAFGHQPGSGFRWQFTVSRRGFSVGPFSVCQPLEPGQYRFVYWGLSGKNAIADRFQIE